MSVSQRGGPVRQDGPVTTRLGFSIILAGVVLLVLRATGVVDRELVDIVAVLFIVIGALGVAIDGEAADRGDSNDPRNR
jgi:hypothetical protein